MTEKGIEVVMNALAGTPTVVTADFANEVEQILREKIQIEKENNIQPNLLRNWKKEFLDKTSVVFDDTREDNLKEKLALERKEKAENAKKSRPAIRRIKVWEL